MTALSELRPSIRKSYEYICNFIREKGYSPSTREIRDGVPLSSTSVASYHRDQLVKFGLIGYTKDRARSIELSGLSTLTLTFWDDDADYIHNRFGDVSGADLVRELRYEEAVASRGQTRP